MFDDGLNSDLERVHQKGLSRGFDLGWSYKGRFDRQLIEDMITDKDKRVSHNELIKRILETLEKHKCNREFIT